ncbi:MAG: TetR/AcrR family transcriptional regulator [Deltaproteobacteria bacterium]|nr:TetR/AcrR family transcriptional regulator [Deltaproteobacteria bacterium]
MPAARTTRSRRGRRQLDNKQDAILEAALALFVERGFHGTAVPIVADRAGVAAGTIYHYFTSKEALVNVLFRRWKEAIAKTIYTAFPATAPPREQFRTIWEQMARFALANPEAFAFLELHHHRSYLDAESLALDGGLKQFGVGFVTAAQAKGVLKAMEPMLLMELVFGAFNGMFRAHIEGRITLDDAAMRAAEAACWDAVVAR